MEIFVANKKDLEQILKLQKTCYTEEARLYNDFKIPSLTQILRSIKLDYEKEKFLKVQFEGTIIGSVRGHLEDCTCKIGRLIVDKKFRNQGLGTQLMRTLENQFNNTKRFELFTGHKSTKNLMLYQKLGYAEFRKQRVNAKLVLVFLGKFNISTVNSI